MAESWGKDTIANCRKLSEQLYVSNKKTTSGGVVKIGMPVVKLAVHNEVTF